MDTFLKENLITTKNAAELSGYTSDYLARLARSGKIVGKKIGHSWLIDTGSLARFSEEQGDRKVDYARELARTRETEYLLHQDSRRGVAHHSFPNQGTNIPVQRRHISQLDVAKSSLRSNVFAFSVAALVLISAALVAQAGVIQRLAEGTGSLAFGIASGFSGVSGDISSYVASRAGTLGDEIRAQSADATTRRSLLPARTASSLEEFNFSPARPLSFFENTPTRSFATLAFIPVTPASTPTDRLETLRASVSATYAFLTTPSRIARTLEDTFIAFGAAIIDTAHFAIRADVAFAYNFGNVALESARAITALLGNTGDLLARATARAPALTTALYLRATSVPATLAPSIAGAVFDAEYKVAVRFVALANTTAARYVALISGTGNLAYEGTAGTLTVARAASALLSRAPVALEDAYLGMLGKAALALRSLKSEGGLAAVLPALSAGEQAALFTYQTVRGLFDSTLGTLAALLGTSSNIAIVSSPSPTVLPFATSTTSVNAPQPIAPPPAPVLPTSAPAPRIAAVTNNYPTYTTVVKGVSEDFVNQSLASLRTGILATVAGMVQPVATQVATNATTIQQVNMIQDLSNLIVRNGDFRGGIFDNGIRVSATDGNFTNLTGGSISGTSGTLSGNLTVSGTATSTFAGDSAFDTDTLYVDSLNNRVGIATSSPSDTLAVAGPIYIANSSPSSTANRLYSSSNNLYWAGSLIGGATTGTWDTDGTHTWRPTGNVGIGTTSPYAKLSVVGEVVAGYFTATSTTATSTFANHVSIASGKEYRINGVPVMKMMPDAGSGGSFFAGQNAGAANTIGYLNTFIGPLAGYSNTSGGRNTFIGASAGYSNLTSVRNTFVGNAAGHFNTTGGNNVFLGTQAGYNNTTGTGNIFIGDSAGLSTNTGGGSIGIGRNALQNDTSTGGNIAVGEASLGLNTSGTSNVAIGSSALYGNLSGTYNIALGLQALYANDTGYNNFAAGGYALGGNTSGYRNNATGYYALLSNTTGYQNIASGVSALQANTTGYNNVAIGYQALKVNTTGGENTAIGMNAGNAYDNASTTFVGQGANALSSGLLNASAFGYKAKVGASNSLVLGGTEEYAVNVGIGTTSPYAKLSVVGETVSSYFTATSTTATSTFSGDVLIPSYGTKGRLVPRAASSDSTRTRDAIMIGENSFFNSLGFTAAECASFGIGGGTANGCRAGNLFIGKETGLNTTASYADENTIIGSYSSSTAARYVTSLGWGAKIASGPSVNIGASNTMAADYGILISPLNSTLDSTCTNGAIIGSSNSCSHRDSFEMGWGVASTQATEFAYGSRYVASTTPSIRLMGATTIYTGRDMLSLDTAWLPETVSDGTRRAQVLFSTYDYNGKKEFMRADTTGTNPVVKFLNGKVSIGTTSPYAMLTVTATSTQDVIANFIDTASTTVMTILANGNIGIGTTSPYAKLSVVGEIAGAYFTGTTTATSTLAGGLDVLAINQTGSASSTFANGIDLSAGCFAINGTCVGGSSLSGGAANKVAFWTGASTLSNNTNFHWDDTNARLGIGTTSPYAKLSVVGEAVATNFTATSTTATSTFAGKVVISNGTVALPGLVFDGAQTTGLSRNGTSLVISSGGTQVGNFTGSGVYLNPIVKTDSGSVTTPSYANNGDLNTGIYFPATDTLAVTTGGVQRIVFDSTGNVGIGTTSPYAKLSVVGETVSSYFTATSTTATSTFNGGLSITGTGTGLNFGSNTLFYQDNQRFLTSSTTVAGNLTIGYQSPALIDASGGLYNTGVGYQTLGNATSTSYNTAFGYQALKGDAAISNPNVGYNTAIGYQALTANGTGYNNSALGTSALSFNTTGYDNTAMGSSALLYTTTGYQNTAVGMSAIKNNSSGYSNSAFGVNALIENTTGYDNAAFGFDVLNQNTIGYKNTALGAHALYFNVAGFSNTALGKAALYNNTSATNTVAVGTAAARGLANYNAGEITAVGVEALYSVATGAEDNTALGYRAGYGVTTGANNILIGYQAGYSGTNLTTGSNNIIIGYNVGATSTTMTRGLNIGNLIYGTGLDGSDSTLSTGNIGIGTTSPYAKLSVVGETVSSYFTATSTTATSTFMGAVGIGTSTPWRTLSVTGTVAFSGITSAIGAGSLCLTSTNDVTYNSGSDACLSSLRSTKHDINNLTVSGLDTLDALQSVSFVYNTDIVPDGRTRYGFVAEDTAVVDRHLTSYDAKGALSGIDDRAILSVAVRAIQELHAKFSVPRDATTTMPSTVLTADGKGIDLYKLATHTLSGMEALAAKIDAQNIRLTSLEERVAALESGAVRSAGGSSVSFSTSSLASALDSFGVLIQKGIAQFNTLVFRQLVASSDADGTSSAGSVTILAGNTVAQVDNSLVSPSTKIFITFNSQTTGNWWVSDKVAGSFRVMLSAPQAGDVSFDYFLVQTEGALATSAPEAVSGASDGSSGLDTTPPIITLLGDNPVYLSIGGEFIEPGITVTDNAGGVVPYSTFVDGIQMETSSATVDTSIQTTHIITYSATDTAGNTVNAIRSVIVGSTSLTTGGDSSSATTTTSIDAAAPVVTLIGDAAMQIMVGDTFIDPGATATDDIDGDVTKNIVVTGAVDATTIDLYTLTYSATDAAGNSGSSSRVVTVVANTAATTSTSTTI